MPAIDVDAREGVLHIRLANGADGNRFGPEADRLLLAALAQVDDGTKAILLSAEGPDFCTGRASPMPPPGSGATAADLRRAVAEPVLAIYAALRQAPVPVLAAVQGRALGVGAALVACADLAIAAADATFAVPELDRDIPPLLVMTAMAGRIAPSHLMRLVLSRDPVDADEAQRMGLVAQVVPAAALAETIARTLVKLKAASASTLSTIKRFALASDGGGFEAAQTHAADMIALALGERYRRNDRGISP